MSLEGVSYIAVLVAAVAGFVFGSIYYGILSKQWIAAGRIAPDQARPGAALLAITFVCELVFAFVLALVIAGLGAADVLSGMTVSAMIWVGFVLATMTMNHRYQGFSWALTVIDGGHWLGVALLMGAVIGWWQ